MTLSWIFERQNETFRSAWPFVSSIDKGKNVVAGTVASKVRMGESLLIQLQTSWEAFNGTLLQLPKINRDSFIQTPKLGRNTWSR